MVAQHFPRIQRKEMSFICYIFFLLSIQFLGIIRVLSKHWKATLTSWSTSLFVNLWMLGVCNIALTVVDCFFVNFSETFLTCNCSLFFHFLLSDLLSCTPVLQPFEIDTLATFSNKIICWYTILCGRNCLSVNCLKLGIKARRYFLSVLVKSSIIW